MHRFYIPAERWNSEALVLSEAESHHCLTVLRLGEGDKVVAFDGRGSELSTSIESAAKGAVRLAPGPVQKSPELRARIALGQAVPKGKNMDLIIEKATELGVAEIHPLLSERTVIKLDPEEKSRKREKWQRIAIEACKQSGQNFLPSVSEPQTPEHFFAGGRLPYELLVIASLQPGSRHLKTILAEHEEHVGGRPASALVLIGPEGDYTPAEVNLAQNGGCLPMTLGPIVLRTETAAIYSLSVLAYELL